MIPTPLESFITHKAQTGMQCGNYTIDIPPLDEGEQYRFHFDATACVGCHCCEAACNEQNGNPPSVKWRRVGELEGGQFPQTLQMFNSMSCNHCLEPACLQGCPTNSYIKLANGIVYHEDESCIGCQYCTWNCPYEVPVFHKERGIVTKCHMCHEKLAVNQTPACVQACPAGAIMIEKVTISAWREEEMVKTGVAPHLPDVNITLPTTRYTLPELPSVMYPANDHLLTPAHPEWPLVFMTVLTQLSLGAFIAHLLGHISFLVGLTTSNANLITLLLSLLPAAIGLPLSAAHLGRPLLAITAMKNLATSWLSREAAALGGYALVLTFLVIAFWFDLSPLITLPCEGIALGLGVYGIYAQSMIYRIKARPSWNRVATTSRFFVTAYVGFLAIATFLYWEGALKSGVILTSLALPLGVVMLYLVNEENLFYQFLDASDPLYYQLNRTALLFKKFQGLRKSQMIFLAMGALALPFLTIVTANSTLWQITAPLATLALILAFLAEIIGRYLFYVTVVPLGLAGNFFAGNQRG